MAPPPSHRSRLDARASTVLPEDVVYEILLRLPAKDICRLRTVCRSWRSLLSDGHFITAHASFHPSAPLVVVGYGYAARPYCGRVLCDIVDLSGHVVKRVHASSEHERVMCAQLDLLCVEKDSTMICQLLDPATGAVHALPEGLAAEHAAQGLGILDCWTSTAFGLVASTGEYKVLRVLHPLDGHPRQLYEVFTLDDCYGNSQGCWRMKKAPPYHYYVELGYMYSVVMDGIVYFLLSESWADHDADQPGLVASFDLETEEWGASIRGPLTSPADLSWYYFSIAVLSGRVVLRRRTPFSSMASPYIDLWFLMDMEKGVWVKQHSIEISNLHHHPMVQPLLVLNDGRIVLDHNIGNWSLLKIYDPGSKTCTDVVKTYRHTAQLVCMEGTY